MIFLEKISDWFKGTQKLVEENERIRKNKKTIERKYNDLLEENHEVSQKYVQLLEQKSTSFDLYLTYQHKCVKLAKEKSELKEKNKNLEIALGNKRCRKQKKD